MKKHRIKLIQVFSDTLEAFYSRRKKGTSRAIITHNYRRAGRQFHIHTGRIRDQTSGESSRRELSLTSADTPALAVRTKVPYSKFCLQKFVPKLSFTNFSCQITSQFHESGASAGEVVESKAGLIMHLLVKQSQSYSSSFLDNQSCDL